MTAREDSFVEQQAVVARTKRVAFVADQKELASLVEQADLETLVAEASLVELKKKKKKKFQLILVKVKIPQWNSDNEQESKQTLKAASNQRILS